MCCLRTAAKKTGGLPELTRPMLQKLRLLTIVELGGENKVRHFIATLCPC
jgi:hypothetical protein